MGGLTSATLAFLLIIFQDSCAGAFFGVFFQLQSSSKVGQAGFEAETFRLSVERFTRAELPARRAVLSRLMSGWFIRISVNL